MPTLPSSPTELTNLLVLLELILRVSIAVRIIMRDWDTGVTLSWLVVVTALPLVGSLVYLVVGESRLGRDRVEREAQLAAPYRESLRLSRLRPSARLKDLRPQVAGLFRQAERTSLYPALSGNRMVLLSDAEATLQRIRDDIDAAQRSVHMVYYIWQAGGLADEVTEALCRASRRGLRCRLAVDDVGSRRFLASPEAEALRDAGVELVRVLPVGLFRGLFVRADLRNHRKIVIIDGELAYTGSMNLADPAYFKQKSGAFGRWVDAMLRIEGPVVEHLHLLFLQDWELETGHGMGLSDLPAYLDSTDLLCLQPCGPVTAQLVPSGPGLHFGSLLEVLVGTIYTAQEELILTTPYFVPDTTVMNALVAAAHRGVDLHIIVPRRVDSRMVHYAARGFFKELLEAGAKIHLFHGGLLHTKSLTVDGQLALFGTMNVDHRSFWLNFELMLLLRDQALAGEIRDLQRSYMDHAERLRLADWRVRPAGPRFLENVMQLFAPLL